MRGLGLVVLVAACTPSGLTLEVVISDPLIKKVEVMAGDPCTSPDCPRDTIPPGLLPMTIDDGYVVIDPSPFTVTDSDFSDGLATFHIDGAGRQFAMLVILGYDAQGEVRWSWWQHSVQIPSDGVRWQIYLAPTSRITPTPDHPPSGTERFAMWPDPNGTTSCLVLEHWLNGVLPLREMIVPNTDHDCDNVMRMNECAPWVPNALGATPTINDVSCVAFGYAEMMANVCMLAGPLCTEYPMPAREGCVTLDEPYCTPKAFCGCAGNVDQAGCLQRAITEGINSSFLPYLDCVIHVDSSFNRCDSQTLQIDGSMLTNVGTISRACKAIRFSDHGMLLSPFTDRMQVGEAKLRVESFSTPCKADLKWEAGMAGPETLGLVEVELDNGYHLAVPVRVEVMPGCSATSTSFCKFVGPADTTGETMYYCIGAQPVIDVCAPDSSGMCAGPFCVDQCCGRGESCTTGGCSCGGGGPCQFGQICASGVQGPDSCGGVCCTPPNCPV